VTERGFQKARACGARPGRVTAGLLRFGRRRRRRGSRRRSIRGRGRCHRAPAAEPVGAAHVLHVRQEVGVRLLPHAGVGGRAMRSRPGGRAYRPPPRRSPTARPRTDSARGRSSYRCPAGSPGRPRHDTGERRAEARAADQHFDVLLHVRWVRQIRMRRVDAAVHDGQRRCRGPSSRSRAWTAAPARRSAPSPHGCRTAATGWRRPSGRWKARRSVGSGPAWPTPRPSAGPRRSPWGYSDR